MSDSNLSYPFGVLGNNQLIYVGDYDKNMGKVKCSFGHEMVFADGKVRAKYFRHKSEQQDCRCSGKTDWHLLWQLMCKRTAIEIPYKADGRIVHVADIVNNGMVIEIQHSNISEEDVAEREKFYGNMIWIVDGTNCDYGICNEYATVSAKGFAFLMKKPVFIDTGKFIIERVFQDETNMLGLVHLYGDFIEKYFSGILETFPDQFVYVEEIIGRVRFNKGMMAEYTFHLNLLVNDMTNMKITHKFVGGNLRYSEKIHVINVWTAKRMYCNTCKKIFYGDCFPEDEKHEDLGINYVWEGKISPFLDDVTTNWICFFTKCEWNFIPFKASQFEGVAFGIVPDFILQFDKPCFLFIDPSVLFKNLVYKNFRLLVEYENLDQIIYERREDETVHENLHEYTISESTREDFTVCQMYELVEKTLKKLEDIPNMGKIILLGKKYRECILKRNQVLEYGTEEELKELEILDAEIEKIEDDIKPSNKIYSLYKKLGTIKKLLESISSSHLDKSVYEFARRGAPKYIFLENCLVNRGTWCYMLGSSQNRIIGNKFGQDFAKIRFCSRCKKITFCEDRGVWNCAICGAHEGCDLYRHKNEQKIFKEIYEDVFGKISKPKVVKPPKFPLQNTQTVISQPGDKKVGIGIHRFSTYSEVLKEHKGYCTWVLNQKDISGKLKEFQSFLKTKVKK